MNRLTKLVLSGLGTYAAAMMVFAATNDASAAERRVPASICHYVYDTAGNGFYNGTYISTDSTARNVYCPVISDNTLFHSDVVQINMHGNEASGESNYSKACSIDPWSTASSCGTTTYWGADWTGGIGLSTAGWTNLAWFPYIYTYLDSNGRIHGYYMADY